ADAAGGEEVFHIVRARRLQVDQDRGRVRQFVELPEIDPDAGAAGDRRQVEDGVGRARNGQKDPQRVLYRLRGDDVRRLQPGTGELHGGDAGSLRRPDPVRVDGGDRGRAGQKHAQRL